MNKFIMFLILSIYCYSTSHASNHIIWNDIFDGVIRLWVDEGNNNYSLGSAFSINDNGYYVTNHHVIESSLAGNKLVALESTYPSLIGYSASVIWFSVEKDLAIIHVPEWQRPALVIGISENVRKRQNVTSIGFPGASDASFGESNEGFTEPKTKVGIISATSVIRMMNLIEVNLFEHDATINSGNSGGPLVDDCGRVVGINVSKAMTFLRTDEIANEISSEGIPLNINEGTFFAIQANELIEELDRLGIAYEKDNSQCLIVKDHNNMFLFLLLALFIFVLSGFIYIRKYIPKKTDSKTIIRDLIHNIIKGNNDKLKRGEDGEKVGENEAKEKKSGSTYLMPDQKNLKIIELFCNKMYLIGREPSKAQIVLSHHKISRLHAKIQMIANGDVQVVDLGSANGTYVDHKKISVEHWETILPGQRLRLGSDEVVYRVKKY